MGEKMKAGNSIRVALTVAGSDSGGGAGIQADLKTFHALGVFGTSAITCITAQNPRRVSAVLAVDPRLVGEQMVRVLEAFPIGAAKTGMLYDSAIIEVVAAVFCKWKIKSLVIDPVMVSSSGARLLKKEAIAALTRKLLPLASIVTPNLSEAEVLSRSTIRSLDQLREAARALADEFGVPVLVKGGHLKRARRAVDVLFDGHEFYEFAAPMVPKIKTHGTGCTFSAAITANLALGHDLRESVRRAKLFVTQSIRRAVRIGNHRALRI